MSVAPRMPGDIFDPTTVSTRRSMALCALGAIVGLGIAGYGLFTAAGTSTREVPPENVATINQRPILRSDFITQLEMETGETFEKSSRADQLRVLDEMVREELLVQRSLELDFGETDQGSRNALVAAISDQAIAEATTSEVTEQQLREYFSQNPGKWASEGVMTLRQFLLPVAAGQAAATSMASARSVIAGLHGGAQPERLLAQAGVRELARQDEEYYFVVKYRLGDAVFAAATALDAGAFSDPVAGTDGVHFVQMINNQKPVPMPFEVARPQVLSDYNEAVRTRLMENTLKFLRSRAKVQIAKDYAGEYKP
jgi:hypothetical protein